MGSKLPSTSMISTSIIGTLADITPFILAIFRGPLRTGGILLLSSSYTFKREISGALTRNWVETDINHYRKMYYLLEAEQGHQYLLRHCRGCC